MSSKMEKFPGFPQDPATNYWPYPKALNGWWHELTLPEQAALNYILRHTWGFKKTADKIAYNQFIYGVRELDGGCGIKSKETLATALDGLEEKGFIEITRGKGRGNISKYKLKFVKGTGGVPIK